MNNKGMINKSCVHIVGATGAGTTTLGKALERRYGYKWMDTDGHFWMPSDPPYSKFLPFSERVKLISKSIERNNKCVICGSLCGWGDVFIPLFDFVIFLYTPTNIRIDRLEKREYERFGERIRKGGDMYEEHIKFIEWSKTYDDNRAPPLFKERYPERSLVLHENWLKLLPCPVLRLDGTTPVNELLRQIEVSNL
jgi:adenylate kinase family enzyme